MSLGAIEESIKWRRRGLDGSWLPDSFMAELPAEALPQIEQRGRVRKDVESIKLTGDEAAVVIVLNRAVKVFRSSWGGKQTLVHVAGEGDLLNAEALLTSHDIPNTMLAAGERAEVFTMPRRRFGQLVARDEDIRRALMHSFARRVQEHDTWRGHLGRALEAQVWAFLVGLARRHGYRSNAETHLALDLTQQEIASALGVSSSSVESAMRNLRKAGRLRTGYAWVALLDVPTEEALDLDC